MYLIVGLGNPEEEYANTRHNVGFDTINELAKKNDILVNRSKYESIYGKGIIKNENVTLLKPQTYMNLSGRAVRDFKNFYKIEDNKIIVIYDDIDIPFGIIKVRKMGGPGTHNGMKSVIQELGKGDFYRIRIGVRTTKRKKRFKRFYLRKNK